MPTQAPISPWIRRFHPAPAAGKRLVLLPHAGGSASFFFPVSRALAPTVDVLAVQYPGRQDRRGEACVDDMDTLADLVTAELLPWTDRPLALFGHSLGAVLGYEVARRLEERGTAPLKLYVSARRAPADQRGEAVHLLDDDALVKTMAVLAGTELEVPDEELLRVMLPSLRSDYKAVETYRHRPGPPLGTPVVALTGDRDPKVTPEEAGEWSRYTTGAFDLRVFDGGHFYLVRHLDGVADVLRETLA
ncbi:thioesterase II family protein [Streptomyces gibsoniae]|uniref:Alpha/beta fold hydrolase n=1 Tax=Streptomyces gibsoniae TaxID=3075529 RepID=A0ABU2TSG0_9ACTN|nr:alpha/beta fold hydrolase [Streptomyces sp. DSM 41699]MDT0463797.1 alpha/beta fold hydrolase [Streptomyces sp. DSM 41699]